MASSVRPNQEKILRQNVLLSALSELKVHPKLSQLPIGQQTKPLAYSTAIRWITCRVKGQLTPLNETNREEEQQLNRADVKIVTCALRAGIKKEKKRLDRLSSRLSSLSHFLDIDSVSRRVALYEEQGGFLDACAANPKALLNDHQPI